MRRTLIFKQKSGTRDKWGDTSLNHVRRIMCKQSITSNRVVIDTCYRISFNCGAHFDSPVKLTVNCRHLSHWLRMFVICYYTKCYRPPDTARNEVPSNHMTCKITMHRKRRCNHNHKTYHNLFTWLIYLPKERILKFSVHNHSFKHGSLSNNKLNHSMNRMEQWPESANKNTVYLSICKLKPIHTGHTFNPNCNAQALNNYFMLFTDDKHAA